MNKLEDKNIYTKFHFRTVKLVKTILDISFTGFNLFAFKKLVFTFD